MGSDCKGLLALAARARDSDTPKSLESPERKPAKPWLLLMMQPSSPLTEVPKSQKNIRGLASTTNRQHTVDKASRGLATCLSCQVIITASHNPGNWNALKFLNHKGEFISPDAGKKILELAQEDAYSYAEVDALGDYSFDAEGLQEHISAIKDLPLVRPDEIKKRGFKIAVDGVNSSGGIAIPKLLLELGVRDVVQLNCDPTGNFAHDPEPLPKNLQDLCKAVIDNNCDLGISVDPDVDRLALINEKGEPFGEEYTLVAVADYILNNKKGAVVSNMSSSRALRDLAIKHGVEYHSSPVGEVHVVHKMKDVGAVIGGEGNGGVVYPDLHYGRDALVGVALLLSHLALEEKSISELKSDYEDYFIFKDKIELGDGVDIQSILEWLKKEFDDAEIDERDGVKFDFKDSWAHLRRSNTEPIIRIYAEGRSEADAQNLAERVKSHVQDLTGKK